MLKIVDSFRDSLRAGQFSSEGDGGRRIVEIGELLEMTVSLAGPFSDHGMSCVRAWAGRS